MRLRHLLIAAPLLVGALLSPQSQVVVALAAIIILGVPHGALDGELARAALRPTFGWSWLPVFAVPYLALSALVLVAWHVTPVVTLTAFLAMSVWHFGAEDAGGGSPFDALVRGGLPVAIPMLAHSDATVALFEAIAGTRLTGFTPWWIGAAMIWVMLAATWTVRALIRRRWRDVVEPGFLLGAFLVLPPLTAFALYFVCIHAPAHTAALVNDRRAVRIRDTRSAWRCALPFTALTVLLGAALWPLYHGVFAPRLLALTIQGLAALTLPHMLLGTCLAAWTGSATRVEQRFA